MDLFRHTVGDDVLRFLAQTMIDLLAEDGLYFRYGGEEFTVLWENKSVEEAYEIAEKLRKRIANTNNPTGRPITISLGLTMPNSEDTDPKQIIMRADAALYTSKRTGRNKPSIDRDENM